MKKLAFILLFITTAFISTAQTTDTQLTQRLNHYMQLNKTLDFEQLMNYMHPVLFSVAPKEAMQQAMAQAFNNDEMKISIDSLQVLTVGDDFKQGQAVYKKVDYYMGMSMVFKDNMLEDESFREMIIAGMKEAMGNKQVSYDEKKKALMITGNEVMFAIKDNPKNEWLFLGYDKNPELIKAIFPKSVIAHYKLL